MSVFVSLHHPTSAEAVEQGTSGWVTIVDGNGSEVTIHVKAENFPAAQQIAALINSLEKVPA